MLEKLELLCRRLFQPPFFPIRELSLKASKLLRFLSAPEAFPLAMAARYEGGGAGRKPTSLAGCTETFTEEEGKKRRKKERKKTPVSQTHILSLTLAPLTAYH